MTLVIGTDEAGYGPNLGPLVVAATAWQVDAGADPARLDAAFASAAEAAGPLWGDSKRIFRGGAGFVALERGALVGLALASGGVPATWEALVAAIAAEQDRVVDGKPGPAEAGVRAAIELPLEAIAADCLKVAGRVEAGLAAGGVTLTTIRCRVIQPQEFNRLLAAGLNKSDILSQATLDLAAPLVAAAMSGQRSGGRRPLPQSVSQRPESESMDRYPEPMTHWGRRLTLPGGRHLCKAFAGGAAGRLSQVVRGPVLAAVSGRRGRARSPPRPGRARRRPPPMRAG